jgi:hypothetical protein
MSFILLLFLFFGLLPPSLLAAPSNIQKRSFKVGRVRNANFRGHNGPRELLKTYRKYRMPIPQDLLDATSETEADTAAETIPGNSNGYKLSQLNDQTRNTAAGWTGTGVGLVSATPANEGIEYVSPVKIGGQTINMAFDSGSADLWVFSTQLPAQAVVGHQVYDPFRSPSFKLLPGATFSILYGDGTSASGNVGTDTVDVGGVTVARQAVQMATAVSSAFVKDTHNNGLLGLGFSKLNTVTPLKQSTFFENVMPSLAQPLFTADLRKDTVGAYEFGRIDATKFAGSLSWIPANTDQGFWQFPTGGFRVEKDTDDWKKVPGSQAIVDTGTTLMLVSKEISDGYYSQVPGAQRTAAAGGVTFPCNTTLPDLLIDVGGVYTARVGGLDINFGKFKGDCMS